jgi:hypothetical protein
VWRCASASRRERATVYELRIHHAALVFGRSIEPRARRAPGAVPRPFPGPPPHGPLKSPYDHATTIRISGPRARAHWGIGPHGSHTRRTPHPTRQAHGRHGPRGRSPESRQARPPHPAAIISRCSATASVDARHCRCRGATPDTPRSAHRARGPGSRGAPSAHHIVFDPPRAPRLKPNSSPARSLRDARTTITHSGHTFTLDSALSSETSLTPSRDSITRTQLISTQPLILTHNASTHSHSLTQTHPLTHSHASTHSHSLEVRVDAHLTGSR